MTHMCSVLCTVSVVVVHFKPNSYLEIFCPFDASAESKSCAINVGVRTFRLFPKFSSCTFRGRAEIDEILANGRSDCTASISWCRHNLDSVCPDLPAYKQPNAGNSLQSCKNWRQMCTLRHIWLTNHFSFS